MSLPRLGARSTHLPKPPAHTRPVALYGSCLIRQVHLERDLLGLHHGRATRIQTRAVPLPQVRAKNTNSHPTEYLILTRGIRTSRIEHCRRDDTVQVRGSDADARLRRRPPSIKLHRSLRRRWCNLARAATGEVRSARREEGTRRLTVDIPEGTRRLNADLM